MLRMTLILVACIFAAMSIWGEPPASDVEVARADGLSSGLAGFGAGEASAEAAQGDLSEIDAEEAVAMALAAGEEPAPEPTEPATAAGSEPEEEAPVVYVTGSQVNLREGPTTNSAVVGSVSRGDRAEPLSDLADPWVQIRTERGQEAWIFGRFLSETPA